MFAKLTVATAFLLLSPLACVAQEKAPATPPKGRPGAITEGAQGVSIGGAPAARAGDRTSEGSSVVRGSSHVYINGRPAVTVGDVTACGGVVVGGASNVFINGKPMARAGDATTACPGK